MPLALGMMPKFVEPAVVALPRYDPNAGTHDRFEQPHMLEIGQIDAAPMLDLVRRAEMKRSP